MHPCTHHSFINDIKFIYIKSQLAKVGIFCVNWQCYFSNVIKFQLNTENSTLKPYPSGTLCDYPEFHAADYSINSRTNTEISNIWVMTDYWQISGDREKLLNLLKNWYPAGTTEFDNFCQITIFLCSSQIPRYHHHMKSETNTKISLTHTLWSKL